MPRGNPYARGDPMKTRSEKRRDKKAKLAKTGRVMRLKRRVGRITARKFAGQEDSHMTALMESYILRRKAERAAEKAREEQSEGAAGAKEGVEFTADYSDGTEEGGDESGSDAFSLGSADDDSAFEMSEKDDDADAGEEKDIAKLRRRASEAKRGVQSTTSSRGEQHDGRARRAWNDKKDSAAAPNSYGGRGGGASFTQRGRGRGGARGGASNGSRGRPGQRGGGAGGYQQRSSKVATRSLY